MISKDRVLEVLNNKNIELDSVISFIIEYLISRGKEVEKSNKLMEELLYSGNINLIYKLYDDIIRYCIRTYSITIISFVDTGKLIKAY